MQNARPLCKKVQPMPVTIFRASVWANVLEEGQETSQITTQIGQENGKEWQCMTIQLDMNLPAACKMEHDAIGHYARPDVLELKVNEI